ncbi:MAG: PD-(D/E)XK nuclease family protein [Candidatus Wildermuthbacteria bacterium]|nr:PD-(D/E)XK nuclease family protein [Candidatus Wildermuthbacteria bacterium]
MAQYYFGKRTRNVYDPSSREPYALSRSRLETFLNCPRCFYVDRRLGVDKPPGYPFSLNSAVDALLKKEFDVHRLKQTKHPLMEAYGVDAVPFDHENINEWRENFKGVQYLHKPTNFLVTGAVDDIWVNPEGELIVVDYKSTSKNGEVNIDAEWQKAYKNQMEIYQWLLRRNGFSVSATGYFVYVNGKTDVAAFDGKLEFDVKLIPYTGDDSWVEDALAKAKECLMGAVLPPMNGTCDYCLYIKSIAEVLRPFAKKTA